MQVVTMGVGRPLVLVHGAITDGRVWMPQAPLSRDFALHLVSLTGYHPDTTTPDDVCAETHVRELCDYLRSLGTRASLLGHSRGGRLALEVAARASDAVSHLMLVEPGGISEPDFYDGLTYAQAPTGMPDLRPAVAALIAQGRKAEALELYIDHGHGPGTWCALARWFQKLACDNAHTMGMMIRDKSVPMSRTSARLVRAPTRLVLGSKSPGVFHDTAKVLASEMSCLESVQIDSDHFMTVKQADCFNEKCLSWLKAA
jgi:pimeloyl-ACP methyl ester carboxylesterase